MFSSTTILPWRNASELAFVRDCFYPHHAPTTLKSLDDVYDISTSDVVVVTDTEKDVRVLKKYKSGLKRVEIWMFRSPASVPRAVGATAGLVDARVADQALFDVMGSSLSEMSLKSVYAMAFVRFVNGFVDRDVSRAALRTGLSAREGDEEDEVTVVKGVGESSMYAHAVTIGMPSSFVDLRHRCVHGEVPDLVVLRRMCERALGWLWERWWKGNAIGDRGRWEWEIDGERRRYEGDGSDEEDELAT